jgi:hypothetical protein
MKKMTTVFQRKRIPNQDVKVDDAPGHTNWVIEGEGIATRKWDGQAVLVQDGKFFARYDAKHGKTPPPDFIPAQPDPDPITGHWPGWRPVVKSDKPINLSIQWWQKNIGDLPDGTYEAVGPLIGTRHGKNPENLDEQILVRHGVDILDVPDRSFKGIKEFLRDKKLEVDIYPFLNEGDSSYETPMSERSYV